MSGALARRYPSEDNRAKQRLEKSGLKVNKTGGDNPCKARALQLVINNYVLSKRLKARNF